MRGGVSGSDDGVLRRGRPRQHGRAHDPQRRRQRARSRRRCSGRRIWRGRAAAPRRSRVNDVGSRVVGLCLALLTLAGGVHGGNCGDKGRDRQIS